MNTHHPNSHKWKLHSKIYNKYIYIVNLYIYIQDIYIINVKKRKRLNDWKTHLGLLLETFNFLYPNFELKYIYNNKNKITISQPTNQYIHIQEQQRQKIIS